MASSRKISAFQMWLAARSRCLIYSHENRDQTAADTHQHRIDLMSDYIVQQSHFVPFYVVRKWIREWATKLRSNIFVTVNCTWNNLIKQRLSLGVYAIQLVDVSLWTTSINAIKLKINEFPQKVYSIRKVVRRHAQKAAISHIAEYWFARVIVVVHWLCQEVCWLFLFTDFCRKIRT